MKKPIYKTTIQGTYIGPIELSINIIKYTISKKLRKKIGKYYKYRYYSYYIREYYIKYKLKPGYKRPNKKKFRFKPILEGKA